MNMHCMPNTVVLVTEGCVYGTLVSEPWSGGEGCREAVRALLGAQWSSWCQAGCKAGYHLSGGVCATAMGDNVLNHSAVQYSSVV